ncbi:MAG: agmatinase [Planctomycetota bacterium]
MSIGKSGRYKTHPWGFGAIPRTAEQLNPSVCIVPFPYDSASTSNVGAARRGPEAILRASRNLELFDCELGVESCKVGIETMDEVEQNSNSPFENAKVCEAVVGDVLEAGKLPVLLGGDHSLTLGAVRAVVNRQPEIGVLVLDAHPDVFDEFEGTKYGHGSVTRRVHELGVRVAVAGVRCASRGESDFISGSGITVVTARQMLESKEAIEGALAVLPGRIYLSIDLDVLDPGEMPAVANPEPGGLRWYDTVDCLERVVANKKVVGFDVVELCPIAGNSSPDFTAAKLIYRLIGLIFKDRLLSADR